MYTRGRVVLTRVEGEVVLSISFSTDTLTSFPGYCRSTMTTDGLALAATILVAQLVPDRKVALEKACLDYLMRDNPLKIIQLCDEVYKQPPGVASTIRTTTPTTSEIPTRQRPSEEDTNTAPPAKKARPSESVWGLE
jgi:hypothetical protein